MKFRPVGTIRSKPATCRFINWPANQSTTSTNVLQETKVVTMLIGDHVSAEVIQLYIVFTSIEIEKCTDNSTSQWPPLTWVSPESCYLPLVISTTRNWKSNFGWAKIRNIELDRTWWTFVEKNRVADQLLTRLCIKGDLSTRWLSRTTMNDEGLK